MRLVAALFVILVAQSAVADGFQFKKYRHEQFRHLEFDILTRWLPTQNRLETVFFDPTAPGPELYFQTVGKAPEFQDAQSFVAFLKGQDPLMLPFNVADANAGGHPAIRFEYREPEPDQLHVYVLVVDVGEGILWFYLKVPRAHAPLFKPIIERVQASLSFR